MLRVASFLIVLFVLAGCSPDKSESKKPRQEETGYWARPVPLQGSPPAAWSPLEKSLYPKDCGTCHPSQYADWQTTYHSKAMSPGLEGQIVATAKNKFTRSCYKCHAPLSEQQRFLEQGGKWVKNESYDSALREAGVSCAVCHVRDGQRHGPPPSDGGERTMSTLPHGGFVIDDTFEKSEFCAACHQFPESWPQLNGKLLENTHEEWKESRAFREGKTCQNCHMPDRRHLFRGIHDPDMTRSAFEFEATLEKSADGAMVGKARLTNVGAGHMAPTYVTPRIVIDFRLVDVDGKQLGERSEPTIIQRHVILGGKKSREVFDTRLAQDGSIEGQWTVPRADGAAGVKVEVRCIPDYYYEEFYKRLLKRYKSDGKPHKMIAQALAEAEKRRFVIFEKLLAI